MAFFADYIPQKWLFFGIYSAKVAVFEEFNVFVAVFVAVLAA